MMFERTKQWPDALSTYLDRVSEYRFKWGATKPGTHDCATFVCGAIKAQTGVDITGDFAGKYTSWIEAGKWLIDNGYRSFYDCVTDKLGESIHASQARRGDIVGRQANGRFYLGVCVGKFSYFLDDNGTTPWPSIDCDACWRIG